MNEHIYAAVATFRQFPEMDDEEIFYELVRRGVPRQLAARSVELVPSAYCRTLLQESGVKFSDTFTRSSSNSELKTLTSEPIWMAALVCAESEKQNGVSKDDFLRVAGRSAEFQAVNQMLHRGTQLENIVLTPISLPWTEEGP